MTEMSVNWVEFLKTKRNLNFKGYWKAMNFSGKSALIGCSDCYVGHGLNCFDKLVNFDDMSALQTIYSQSCLCWVYFAMSWRSVQIEFSSKLEFDSFRTERLCFWQCYRRQSIGWALQHFCNAFRAMTWPSTSPHDPPSKGRAERNRGSTVLCYWGNSKA